MKVLIIIPAYNEEKSIVRTVQSIIKEKYDYIVVNDGSGDGTGKILDQNNYNHIDLISNLGIGGAMQTGYKYAFEHDYDIAVQFDADGQHDVEHIKSIIDPIKNGGVDFVIGSRFINKTASKFKSTKLRQIGIKLLSSIIMMLSGKRIFDVTSGFRAANRKVIEMFAKSYPQEYPEPVSDFELIRSGVKLKEVQVSMNKRFDGKSSINSWKSAYYIINVTLSIIIIKMRTMRWVHYK